MTATPVTELFGFLKYPHSINFDGGMVEQDQSYEDGLKYINKKVNKDGYFYPPEVISYKQELNLESGLMETPQIVPKSRKPSPVFLLPKSHVLHINQPIDRENVRGEDAGLLLHLIGFLFGTRLQFSDWRFDGKVPVENKNYLSVSNEVSSDFISHTYCNWKRLTSDQRKYFINILYMHGKAKSCEWEWDEFLYQYMVFDALYRFYVMLGNEEIRGHKKRLEGLCTFFNIEYNTNRLELIYKLRNNFFHEALWYIGTPGLQKKEPGSHLIPKCLERLNSQIITAILGYTNNYSKSSSWADLNFRGQIFDKLID